jgi:hypothetical protein
LSFNKESASAKAKEDLAKRLKISANEVEIASVVDAEFSDMSLGASTSGEFAAQMISSGWRINLKANGKNYEYRADKYQLRVYKFDGKNYVIK